LSRRVVWFGWFYRRLFGGLFFQPIARPGLSAYTRRGPA
jgi:hypothetical protein